MDAAGNLYGVTSNGGPDEALGSSGGYGTVYEVNGTTHVLTTLASFDNTDDEYVGAGLMADAQGNLYGTTESGGDGGYGTVYEITNSGYVVSVPEPVSLGVGMGLGLGLLMFSRSLLRGRNSLS